MSQKDPKKDDVFEHCPLSEWPIKHLQPRKFSILRVSLLTIFLVSLGVCGLSYQWLKDLGVLNINKSQLKTIIEWDAADNSIVFDKDGTKIGEFYSSYHLYTPYESFPPHLVNAIIAIEDQNFWSHPGVDYQAIIRAAWSMIKRGGKKTQGGSTITQQVVRHFLLTKEKAFERKVKEIFLALELEKHLSKQQIFEIYGNALFLGNRSYGLGAASSRYFNKPVSEVNEAEASMLAGLFQSPSRYDPSKQLDLAKKRQKQVIRAMFEQNFLNKKKAITVFKTPIKIEESKTINHSFAPYFIDFIKEQASEILEKRSIKNKGLRIHTTLDSNIQRLANQTMLESESLFTKAGRYTQPLKTEKGTWEDRRVESSMLITSPKTGEILGMVGGRNYKISQFNRATTALRSPGSSFKPIVYSYALLNRKKWNDQLYVAPVTVDGNYRPRGVESDYLTETTMLQAFYRSMNAPTVELAKQLGINEVIAHARKMGIDTEIRDEFGSILGGSETNLLSMAQVYSTFANQGIKTKSIAITKITDRDGHILFQADPLEKRQEETLPPQVAYLMTQGMKNVLKYGTGTSEFEMAQWAVGKTGTSNQSKDNWFCGYSSELTVVVWSGTDDFSPMTGKASGATLALPVWAKFMKKKNAQKPPPPFDIPSDVVSFKINPKYGNPSRMGVEMWFTEDNQPTKEDSPLQALQKSEKGYRKIFSH